MGHAVVGAEMFGFAEEETLLKPLKVAYALETAGVWAKHGAINIDKPAYTETMVLRLKYRW